MFGGCSWSLAAWDRVPQLVGGCEHWDLISFLSAPAIPPVIMNALEKRAFLKVLVVLGWEGGQGDTPLACHSAGTPLGNRHLPTLSTPPTRSLSLSPQRYPYLNAPLQVGLVGLW